MKGNLKKLLGVCAVVVLSGASLLARPNIGQQKRSGKALRTSAACAPASSSVELDVNNVRCLIHNGGDFWWDLVSNPRYEIPKVDNPADKRYSSFAGSLWIGGIDESGQLRVAAQTYRQSGNDYWPGPLTSTGASTDNITCEKWDKHFKINKSEIDAFRAAFLAFQNGGPAPDMSLYPNVDKWPAFGEDADGTRIALAPYVDVDLSGTYDPAGSGDYPDIAPCQGGGEPDQAIWWVLNDRGDVHTETGGEAIGLEIQMLAFAFATANAINDMTFYKYKVINKSNLTLTETYMGQWVDADVGNYADDYVGCDTLRGLGFAYNGDANDDGATGYGVNPPAFGMDFFQGPYGDDGIRLPMQRFVYYENDFSLRGNPEVATHFYGYLRGYWKDGSQMVNNGTNGYPGTAGGPPTNFIYPGDVCANTGWTEVAAGNQPFDRRFLQSAGPFTLQPGAVNDIVTGAVWARGYYNDNRGSICEIYTADDIAQALFDNCFQRLTGPDAPDVEVEEFDQELLIKWGYENNGLKNNFHESYLQADPVLKSQGAPDSVFRFQGYLVYQLKDNTVSLSDVSNSDKARLIGQCDLKDGISTIVNRTTQSVAGLSEPIIVDEVMVTGNDKGIYYSVRATEDQFATGNDRRLKNYTTYYYAVVAYAYNDTSSDGRKFLPGDRFFVNTPATPHKIEFENFGTIVNSGYADGIPVTQSAAIGNGENYVRIMPESELAILQSYQESQITYQPGSSPINLKISDPKKVQKGNYRLEVVRDQPTGTPDTIFSDASGTMIDSTFVEWYLYYNNALIDSSTYIKRSGMGLNFNRPNPLEGISRTILGHGLELGVKEAGLAGDTLFDGVIAGEMSFENPLNAWLTGVPDDDNFDTWNWLLCGEEDTDRGFQGAQGRVNYVYDKKEYFEGIMGGTWGPFCMARSFVNDISGTNGGKVSPGVNVNIGAASVNIPFNQAVNLSELPDVDIVMTPDTTKWSRCVVVETSPAQNLGSGAFPMSARWEKGYANQSWAPLPGVLDESTQGWSYFPGYAIDVNTGTRLNIFFGESSWDKSNNGDDLIFNPTANIGSSGTEVGGRHYIYVSSTKYDGCAVIHDVLSNKNNFNTSWNGSQLILNPPGVPASDTTVDMKRVYKNIAWVGVPLLNPAFSFDDPHNMPSPVRISLRTKRPFISRPATTDYPIFSWNTEAYAPQTGVTETAEKSLMEQVRVVPNPYYGFSEYESSQIQTTVKITNLPQKCKIRIYTLNGTLIRTYNKDSDAPSQEWDMKNSSGVPVASGVYIIHVDGFELGETVLKFFAIMPQIDLNSF